MIDRPLTPHADSDRDVLAEVAGLLDGLGPFDRGTLRKDKWRTTEQLAHALLERSGLEVDLDRLDALLQRQEAEARARLTRGESADALIRRATYPDRTTALPLWGSTKHHGQPWLGQAQPERLDPPGDVPPDLRLTESMPRVFVSHARHDAVLAERLAHALAVMGIGSWMFETDIEYRRNIASCVREAIAAAAGCTALVTRDSVASLWVLTELHTALQHGKPIWLILDASDGILMRLLASVEYHHPEAMFDTTLTCDEAVLDQLRVDYAHRYSSSRSGRYSQQVRAFLTTVPLYLSGHAALAYPDVPAAWQGHFALAPLGDLLRRIEMLRES